MQHSCVYCLPLFSKERDVVAGRKVSDSAIYIEPNYARVIFTSPTKRTFPLICLSWSYVSDSFGVMSKAPLCLSDTKIEARRQLFGIM